MSYGTSARTGRTGLLRSENEKLKEDNYRLRSEINSLRTAFKALYDLQEMMATLSSDLDPSKLVDKILEAAMASIEAADGSLMLLDDETNELVFVVVHGEARERLMDHRIPLGTGIAGWVAQKAEPVLVPNVSLDPRFSQRVDEEIQFKTYSLMCTPLMHNERVVGVIQGLNKKNGKTFTEADLMLLSVVGQMAATAIVQAEEFFDGEE